MAAPRSKTRRHILKPDEKGRFRQRIGVRAAADGQFAAVRFNFGTDPKQVAYRYAAVQALYEDEIKAGADCWTVAGLELAQQIARGEAATLPPPQPTQIIEGGRVTGFGYFAERAEVDGFPYYNTSLSGTGDKYPDLHSKFLAGEDSYLLLTFDRAVGKMTAEIKSLAGEGAGSSGV